MTANRACGRRDDRAFKPQAVTLVRGGRSMSQVARELRAKPVVVGPPGAGGQRRPDPARAQDPRRREREAARATPPCARRSAPCASKGTSLEKSVGPLVSGEPRASYPPMEMMQHAPSRPALVQALEVCARGFHAPRPKDRGQHRQEDPALARASRPVFAASRQTDGCPRGGWCGENRAARLRRAPALQPKQKRLRRPLAHRPAATSVSRSPGTGWPRCPHPAARTKDGGPTSAQALFERVPAGRPERPFFASVWRTLTGFSCWSSVYPLRSTAPCGHADTPAWTRVLADPVLCGSKLLWVISLEVKAFPVRGFLKPLEKPGLTRWR